ncbi:ferredoxin [Frankia sp. CNm7]|uniref:Ferredoxin n=1 Tax=Frankia nepalensis TaxID=1836974 RepID=A0A937RDP1_9ACTN|nr:ferredoxin [Frankia nepalensis]MBL7501633.1 ferredoxin [Frankia nepalensis]MBL7516000.1 ferredoxin [Frankia nepalensis]MBL7519040.1 ferredoxin [Frankia nepalensis]MBL7628032.1 ferredoxin [Frankia nepalensis]
MKVVVDGARCTGHAQCNVAAPEVFTLDDLGYALPGEIAVSHDTEPAARRGALACPERAITVE